MKKGYHSTQDTVFGMPYTEFIGMAAGVAAGNIISGFLKLDSIVPLMLCTAVGFAVGWWLDYKYHREPDVSAEQLDREWLAEHEKDPA